MNLSFNFAAGYGLTCLSLTLISGEFINLDFDSPIWITSKRIRFYKPNMEFPKKSSPVGGLPKMEFQ